MYLLLHDRYLLLGLRAFEDILTKSREVKVTLSFQFYFDLLQVHDVFTMIGSSYMNWMIVVELDILKKHRLL